MASKLNKKDLYEQFKKLQKQNTKLQLFLNNSEDVRNKQKIVMECQEKEIEQLHENLEVLNQENRELKEELENSIEKQAFDGYRIEYEKLEKENKKLQEEIKLKDEIIRLHEQDEKDS